MAFVHERHAENEKASVTLMVRTLLALQDGLEPTTP